MNSSISSSEPQAIPASASAWRGFSLAFLVAGLFAMMLALGAAFVVDPYDTGRPGLFKKTGVRPQGPRTAAASRGRDPAFDSAIFGNSHVQLLSPERIGSQVQTLAQEKSRFVSLIAPATHPREQLALLDWFNRHHKDSIKAIVIGIDGNWCTGDPALPNEKPFPFWLYERSTASYLRGLMRYETLEETPRRISFLMGKSPERARADGYWDYEPNYIGLGYDVRADRRTILEKPQPTVPVNATGRFPAAERLALALRDLPDGAGVILLHPPVYQSGLPKAGSPEAATDMACKAAFAAVAAGRPQTYVLDWRGARAESLEPGLWFDHTHYRRPIAEAIETDIARMLGGIR
jgi:hypothetical protein